MVKSNGFEGIWMFLCSVPQFVKGNLTGALNILVAEELCTVTLVKTPCKAAR
jgi:hypothetical protein